jgi:PAS domain S-box-containing protein
MARTELQQQRFRGTLLKMWLVPLLLLLGLVAVLLWQIDRLLVSEDQTSKANEVSAQTQRVEQLLLEMKNDGSQQSMDRMRGYLRTLLMDEELRRERETRAAVRWAKVVVGLSIGLTLVLGVIVAVFSRRQFIALFSSYNRALNDIESQAEAVRRSEQRYRLLFENNPHPMWLYDTETLAFLEINEAAVTHYGYTREEFLSMTIKEIRPISDIPALIDNVAHLRNRIDRAGIWKHRKKDGTLIDVEITSHVLEMSGRRAEIVLANDVTTKLRAQRELLELNNSLEQKVVERTKQLETANGELEAFTYSVSHDLRAPLRAINGFSRILLEDFAGAIPANAARYLDHVRTNAKQMGNLIDDLLAFSRIGRQSINKQTVDPAEIVKRVLEELQTEQQGRSINISMEKLPAANADPALLKQVFTNLLSNALKYTRGRSNASIDIGATLGNQVSESPVYYVRDNGAGFDMKYAHKLFGVFQRLHRAEEFEGTGVGLATTERIIRRHGGRIWAEAEVDRGATFFFTIQGEPVND